MTKSRAMETIQCKMVVCMRVGGLMVNSMDQAVFIFPRVTCICILMFLANSDKKKCKRGLWEEGQRVMWLDEEILLAKVESKQLDLRSLFKKPDH